MCNTLFFSGEFSSFQRRSSKAVALNVGHVREFVCFCMLPGESVPVTKTPIAEHRQVAADNGSSVSAADQTFHIKEHSRHVLFCRTQVIQTRYYGNQHVKAVVIRTGMW